MGQSDPDKVQQKSIEYRAKAIAAYLRGEISAADLEASLVVSRTHMFRLIERYKADGIDGFATRLKSEFSKQGVVVDLRRRGVRFGRSRQEPVAVHTDEQIPAFVQVSQTVESNCVKAFEYVAVLAVLGRAAMFLIEPYDKAPHLCSFDASGCHSFALNRRNLSGTCFLGSTAAMKARS